MSVPQKITPGRLVRAAAVLAVLPLGACVEIVGGLDRTGTEVALRTSTTIFTEFSSITDFRVPVEITNLGPHWVVYDRWCGWRIDQHVNGRWVAAYYPACTVYSSEYYSVPPGATYYETLPAHSSWRERIGGTVEGTYRVVFEILEEREGPSYVRLREDRTTTNSFIVRR